MATNAGSPNNFGFTLKHWVRDLPASIVVFLVALPLSMGIAIASDAPVSTGLVTAIVGGLIVGFLAGSPLQVSGPAAGLTVTVFALINTLGIERLGVCVLVAGLLQLIAGYFRLGQWFRAVSPSVIQGMLAGIGLLLLGSQVHVMLDDKPRHSGVENLLTIPQAVIKIFPLPDLGNAEERSLATRELRTLGQTHLLQEELKEQVHHLVSAVDLAEDDPMVDSPVEIETAKELRGLVQRQEEVLRQLESCKLPKSAQHFALAQRDVQQALADLREGDVFAVRKSQDKAEESLGEFLSSRKNHGWAALIGLLTITAIVVWQIAARGRFNLIPAALVAVVVATLAAMLVELPVLYVELPDRLTDEIYFPRIAEFRALLDPVTWLFIAQLALIASAETLLCASAVDRLHTGPRTQYDRELQAQGVGNMICGLLCALPMTGVIVRSSANVKAGAKTRLSAILHGLWILLFASVFVVVLRNIPKAALAGVLVYSAIKLIDLGAIRGLAKRGLSEVVIYFATVATIIATDLLVGVLVGIGLSLLKLLWIFSRLEIELKTEDNRPTLHLRGSATFLRLPALAAALEEVPTNAELHIKVDQLDYIDAACLDLLDNWEQQVEPTGGRLVIDAESLEARFWRRRSATTLENRDNGHAAAHAGVTLHRHKQEPI